MRFSGGLDLSEPVCEAIVAVAESAWQRAIRADGTRRERSDVCEIAGRVGEAGGSAAAWAPPRGGRVAAARCVGARRAGSVTGSVARPLGRPRAGVVGKAQLPGGRAPVRRCL